MSVFWLALAGETSTETQKKNISANSKGIAASLELQSLKIRETKVKGKRMKSTKSNSFVLKVGMSALALVTVAGLILGFGRVPSRAHSSL